MQLPEHAVNIVQLICKLAQNADEQGLKLLLKEHCVGEYENGTNAVRELAKSGDITAVNFLLEKFNANLNDAVFGAAEGGHVIFMKRLLAKGGSKQMALCGAIKGHQKDIVDDLLQTHTFSNLSLAIEYAAASSRSKYIYNKLVTRPGFNIDSDEGYGAAATGAASIEDVAMVENIIDHTAYPASWLLDAISGAAKAGKTAYYQTLLDDPRLPQELKQSALARALQGAAFRDAEDEINPLLNKGADSIAIVQGASSAGKLSRVKKNINAAGWSSEKLKLMNTAAAYAVEGGHLDLTNKLVEMGAYIMDIVSTAATCEQWHILNTFAQKLSDNELAELYLVIPYSPSIENQLRIASLIDSEVIRKNYFRNNYLLLGLAPYTPEAISQWVDSKTQRTGILNRLIRKYGLNYDQALAWNSPIVHAWVQGKDLLQNYFTVNIFYRILQMIEPLTYPEAEELATKMTNHNAEIKERRKPGFFAAPDNTAVNPRQIEEKEMYQKIKQGR